LLGDFLNDAMEHIVLFGAAPALLNFQAHFFAKRKRFLDFGP
jgi:hypothetical protein